MKALTRIS